MDQMTRKDWISVTHAALMRATTLKQLWAVEDIVTYLDGEGLITGKRDSQVKQVQETLKRIKDDLANQKKDQQIIQGKKGRSPVYAYTTTKVELTFETLSEDNLLALQHALNMLDGTDLASNANDLWLKVTRNTRFSKMGTLQELKKYLFFDDRYRDNKNRDLVPTLCNFIINQEPIKLWYLPFKDSTPKHVIIHPYSVREYNRRYYLCGMHESGLEEFSRRDHKRQVNLGIDRIVNAAGSREDVTSQDIVHAEEIVYVTQPEHFGADYYANVIGLTVPRDQNPKKVQLAISPEFKGYMETKPLHASQKSTRKQVTVDGKQWTIFEYSLVTNKELINNILHLGTMCKVLAPQELVREVSSAVKQLAAHYQDGGQ